MESSVDGEYERKERAALVTIVVLASPAVFLLLVAFSYYCYIRNKVSKRLKKNRGSARYSNLDWETWLRIALDGARGLDYLHEHVNPPVIHRGHRSSNILLDKNFHAKVSDFGLAKLGPEKAGGHVSTQVLGTQGFIARQLFILYIP